MKKNGPVASPSSLGDVMTESRLNDAVVFCDGSAVMLVNKKQMVIDTNDCGNVPYTRNKVVYVPVSLFSRAYGATVSYDATKGTATIRLSNEALVMDPISAKLVDSSGEKDIKGAAPEVKNGSVFVSIDLFAEAFGKSVDYYDNMSIISDDEDTFTDHESISFLNNLRTQVTSLPAVSTQANLRELIGVSGTFMNVLPDNTSATVQETDFKPAESNDSIDADITAEYDRYIYSISNNKLTVNYACGTNLSTASQSDFDKDFSPERLYVYGDRLVVTGTVSQTYKKAYESNGIFYPNKNICTGIYVYDITDKKNITVIRYLEIQGVYQLSKRAGDLLCVMTYSDAVSLTNGETWYTPYCLDKKGENTNITAPHLENVKYFPDMISPNYTTLVTINLADTVQEPTVNCWLGAGENLLLSDSSLYVAANRYGYYSNSKKKTDSTYIYRFDKADGYSCIAGHGSVAGKSVDINAFSFNSRGFLRIVTSSSASSGNKLVNNLYILNSSLESTGEITGIASSDSFDICFTDDRAFLMYSGGTDYSTLYVADLSDETQPNLLGSAKLDGYTGYIHPIDNNHILTMGKVVTSENGSEPVMNDVKLSLYDISNITEPVETAFTTIGDKGTDSLAFSDKRAFFYDSELKFIAFPLNLYTASDKASEDTTEAASEADTETTTSPDSDADEKSITTDKNNEDDKDNQNTDTVKLEYIGEYFYLITDNTIEYKGRFTHIDGSVFNDNFTGDSEKAIKRVVRKGSYLYAVSDSAITAVDTNDVTQSVTLTF
jgi:hypothetical protein